MLVRFAGIQPVIQEKIVQIVLPIVVLVLRRFAGITLAMVQRPV